MYSFRARIQLYTQPRLRFTKNFLAKSLFSVASGIHAEDLYHILGVPVTATKKDIKRQFYKLSMKFHPDKQQQVSPAIKTHYQRIKDAYTILSDPQLRLNYDRTLKERRARSSVHPKPSTASEAPTQDNLFYWRKTMAHKPSPPGSSAYTSTHDDDSVSTEFKIRMCKLFVVVVSPLLLFILKDHI
jgi:DnaJ-class molecular chaperone